MRITFLKGTKMKNMDGLIRTFFTRRKDTELSYILSRLMYNYQGDMGQVLDALDYSSESDCNIKSYLNQANSSSDLYLALDNVQKFAQKEFERRNLKPEMLWI